MPLPNGATCATCIFFSRSRPPHDNSGQCRINPPVLQMSKEVGTRTIWPLVYWDMWCGEHATFAEEER